MGNNTIHLVTVFSAEALLAGGTATSSAINLNDYKPDGTFSIQVTTVGTGTLKGEFLTSNDGTNFQEPNGATDIFTTHAAGTNQYSFSPPVSGWIKIKITEDGGGATITSAMLTLAMR
jgi:hypothetical protein